MTFHGIATAYAIFVLAVMLPALAVTWYEAGKGKARKPVTAGSAVVSTFLAGLNVITLLVFLGVLR